MDKPYRSGSVAQRQSGCLLSTSARVRVPPVPLETLWAIERNAYQVSKSEIRILKS